MSPQTSIDVLDSTGGTWTPRLTIEETSFYSDGSRWIPIATQPINNTGGTGNTGGTTPTYTQSTNPSNDTLTAKSRNTIYQIPAGKTGFESVGWDRLGGQLTQYNGDYTVSSSAARDSDGWVTLEGLDIKGRFSVNSGVSKVRLRRSRISYSGNYRVRLLGSNTNIRLEDCEVDGLNGEGGIGVAGSGLTLVRTWVHGCVDGIRASYNFNTDTCVVSDMAENTAQDHNDCMQMTSANGTDVNSTNSSTFLNTTFVGIDLVGNGAIPANSAIILKPDTGGIVNVTFDGCFFSGGNYTFYMGNSQASGARPIQNIRVRNCVFGGRAKYGDLTLPDSSVESQVVTEWNNNSKTDGSAFSCINYQFSGSQLNRRRTESELEAALNAT